MAEAGYEEFLTARFRRQRSALWGFFLRGAESAASAEELLQETFMRIWTQRASLAGEVGTNEDGFRRYLWRVARNLMIDEIRRRQRWRFHSEPDDLATDDDTAGAVEMNDCLRVMRETVAGLDNDRSRRCLELWLEGRSFLQIAETTGFEPGQVRGLLQRAKSEVIEQTANRLGLRGAARRGER